MKKQFLHFRIQFSVIQKHCLHAMLLTAIIVCVHLLFPILSPLLPLVLVYNLLIFRGTKAKTKAQLVLIWQTLLPAVPFAIIIALYLSPYIWTLPLVMVLYMVLLHLLKLPANYIFGGILINVAYFSPNTWSFYIYQTIDVLLFSLVAYALAQFFYLQPRDQFKIMYKEVALLFDELLTEVLAGHYSNVSSFFIGYHKMQQLFETMCEEEMATTSELLRYEQLLWEMEEAYFYLRTLVDALVMLTEKLYDAYESAGLKLDRTKMLLGVSPYNFHAKKLLRHVKQWHYLEKMLKEEGIL